jgi:riboflavin synthase alpha subunit
MREIHVEDGLCLRFPGRDEDFNEGVEIGIVAVLMGAGESGFTRCLATANLEQARSVAEKMGYHLVTGRCDGLSTLVTFRAGPPRPKLALVHSRDDGEIAVA